MNIFKKHSEKIFLLFGFVIILVTGFLSGYSYSQEQIESQEIIIEDSSNSCSDFFLKDETILGSQIKGDCDFNKDVSEIKQSSGRFVASKNSTLYHKADCVYVKRIKDENKIFFNSSQEAEDKGFKLHNGE